MNFDDIDYGYPIEESEPDMAYTTNREKPYISGECKFSRTCYQSNCFDCGMYNSI